MKTKKLPLTILFGLLFAVAGGNAFAKNVSLGQLKEINTGGGANNTAPAGEVKVAPAPGITKTTKVNLAPDTKQLTNRVGDIKSGKPPPPVPNPIKEFISKNKPTLFGMGLGAYLGFALFGPAGILLGAIFMLGFITMAAI